MLCKLYLVIIDSLISLIAALIFAVVGIFGLRMMLDDNLFKRKWQVPPATTAPATTQPVDGK
ncbi:MAG: hypothetical protein SGI86_11970 [Deltaproteobacteria bacterium]|nr:hypothetical protein [Deltaproteobacteria bacterium]